MAPSCLPVLPWTSPKLQRLLPLTFCSLMPKIRSHQKLEVDMAFSLKTRRVGTVVVVDMSGRLAAGEAALALRAAVRAAVDDGSQKFVFNLGDVTHIDSSGLG